VDIFFTKSVDDGFRGLPSQLQDKSKRCITAFLECYETHRFPKGLRIHKCGPFLSLSVTMQHRIFVLPVSGGLKFVFIGDHEDANRYLKK